MLELTEVHAYYGLSHVLQGVSLRLERGEVVALLGRNGAGKTTTMRTVMGLTRARGGRIVFDGEDITGRKTHAIARGGLAYVPSGRRVFAGLTVLENLELAARSGRRRAGAWTIERVIDTFPRLADLRRRRAGFLSGGEQQMLKLGRALVTNPRLLLLDEPTEGLSPAVVHELGGWLELLRGEGLTLLLTEQNALFALRHSRRAYILEKGRCCVERDAQALLDGGDELARYLGVGVATTGPLQGGGRS